MTWRNEFPANYAVPEVLDSMVRDGLLVDTSWHNDSAPSFMWRKSDPDGDTPRLWAEHPDASQRESVRVNDDGPTERFWVMFDVPGVNGYNAQGFDDVVDAIAFLISRAVEALTT